MPLLPLCLTVIKNITRKSVYGATPNPSGAVQPVRYTFPKCFSLIFRYSKLVWFYLVLKCIKICMEIYATQKYVTNRILLCQNWPIPYYTGQVSTLCRRHDVLQLKDAKMLIRSEKDCRVR